MGKKIKKCIPNPFPLLLMFSMIWRDLKVIINPPIFPLFGNKPQNKLGGFNPSPFPLKPSQT
jgi:hypothetical protein